MKSRSLAVELVSAVDESPFVQEWYDYATADHFWMHWRMKVILRQFADRGIRTDQPLKVLDIGSGRGVFRAQLEAATQWTVDCADLNLAGLNSAEPGRGKLLYYDVTEESPAYLGAYDVITLLDVLEHLDDPDRLLRSAMRHLKPGGFLLVNVPALNFVFSLYDKVVGHLRRYTKASLEKQIAPHAEILDNRYWGFVFVPILMVRKLWLSRMTEEKVVKTGFLPPRPWINETFRRMSGIEISVLPRPPLGSSALLLARKRK